MSMFFKGPFFKRLRFASSGAHEGLPEMLPSNGLTKAIQPMLPPILDCVGIHSRPIFPGFYKTLTVPTSVVQHLSESQKTKYPLLGVFLKTHLSTTEAINGHGFSSLTEISSVGVFCKIIGSIPSASLEQAETSVIFPYRRIRALEFLGDGDNGIARLKVENVSDGQCERNDPVVRALCQEIFMNIAEIAKLSSFFREHLAHQTVSSNIFEDPAKIADLVAVLCTGDPQELQEILDCTVIEERLKKALVILKKELMIAQLQSSIVKDVESKMMQKQREFFLHEQLKSIKKELGLETDVKEKLITSFREKAASLSMPEGIKLVFDEEISKLSVLEPAGAEFNVTRNYLDWITSIPWGKHRTEHYDLSAAASILDQDHYGMEDFKKRILEFIAVSKLRGDSTGKIICLVGPPGVGKTSIGRSIAKALNRDYFRFSVGGLHDVAELKGHRRTYVGAMPGKIIQALKRVQSINPLILIDEVDKIGKGHAGDPASVLLEVLDPEQNGSFLDHYMDIPIDLSKVLFVCTANVTDTIPGPLLDRMEVIHLSGYITDEKLEIARRHLIPTLLKDTGLSEDSISISDDALLALLRLYSRESGVRNLKKYLEKVMRKAAVRIVNGEVASAVVDAQNLHEYAGTAVFSSDRLYDVETLPPGVVAGVAWTAYGGTILYVEAIVESLASGANSAKLIKTGQLGGVMQESSSIAYSFAKSFLCRHQPDNKFFENHSIHLHVPEGATPKDGPSAGCTMTLSLVSLALGKSISGRTAMTGELTLTGKILKIGGVREKIIAAKRSGINRIILPRGNQSDWDDLPTSVKHGVMCDFVETFDEIAKIVRVI